MADSTVALRRERRNYDQAKYVSFVVADGVTIPAGTFVSYTTGTGRAGLGGDDSGTLFAGVAEETVTGDSGGTVSVRCSYGYDIKATTSASGAVAANVGADMNLVDNQTLDDDAGTTNDIKAGVLAERISDTEGWVHLMLFGQLS